MKFNKWTVGLAAVGVVSLASAVRAEEAKASVQTMLSQTTLSGYVDTSAIWRFGTGNGSLPGRSYDGPSKMDGFNLNVVSLTIEKPLDESQWAAGYKTTLLFGPDANTLNTASTGSTTQDLAIKEAYVQLRAPVGNGLDIKMGVFDTIIGYEVFAAGNNPNYSRSYGYYLEPTTYTGILASYRFTDWLSASIGVADSTGVLPQSTTINGRDTVAGSESRKSWMASVALTAPESMGALKGSTLYFGVIDGNVNSVPYASGVQQDQINWYAGATINTPVKGLTVGAAWDYVDNGPNSYGSAMGLYASFMASEKLKFALRGEYAYGTPGTFTSVTPGEKEEYFEITATADYALWANVISRLEFRWDHDAANNQSFNVGSTDGGSRENNNYQLALNVIYQF